MAPRENRIRNGKSWVTGVGEQKEGKPIKEKLTTKKHSTIEEKKNKRRRKRGAAQYSGGVGESWSFKKKRNPA